MGDPIRDLLDVIKYLLSVQEEIKSDDVIYIFAVIRDIVDGLSGYRNVLSDDDSNMSNVDDCTESYNNTVLPLYLEQITTIVGDFLGTLIRDGRCDTVALFLKLLKNEKVVGKDFVLNGKYVNSIEDTVQNECYNKHRAKLLLE